MEGCFGMRKKLDGSCPLCAVANQVSKKRRSLLNWVDAANYLGMSLKQAKIIAIAADGGYNVYPKLYKQMVKACGLTAL